MLNGLALMRLPPGCPDSSPIIDADVRPNQCDSTAPLWQARLPFSPSARHQTPASTGMPDAGPLQSRLAVAQEPDGLDRVSSVAAQGAGPCRRPRRSPAGRERTDVRVVCGRLRGRAAVEHPLETVFAIHVSGLCPLAHLPPELLQLAGKSVLPGCRPAAQRSSADQR